jgi:hypothetical protein
MEIESAITNSASQSPRNTAFPFAKLPLVLRLSIWGYASQTSTRGLITVIPYGSSELQLKRIATPASSQVCGEAWAEYLNSRKEFKIPSSNPSRFMHISDHDTLLIRQPIRTAMTELQQLGLDPENFRSIAFEDTYCMDYTGACMLRKEFSRVEEIVHVKPRPDNFMKTPYEIKILCVHGPKLVCKLCGWVTQWKIVRR